MEAADLEGILGNTHFGFDTTMFEVWSYVFKTLETSPSASTAFAAKRKPAPEQVAIRHSLMEKASSEVKLTMF